MMPWPTLTVANESAIIWSAKGMLGEAQIQKALGSQRGLTFRRLGQEDVESEALSMIPRPTANHLGVIPFCIDDAKRLWLAGAEVPSEALRQTISRYSTLSLGFVLITRSNFNELAAARLSQASQAAILSGGRRLAKPTVGRGSVFLRQYPLRHLRHLRGTPPLCLRGLTTA